MTENPNTDSPLNITFDITGLLDALKSDDALHRRQAAAALGGMKATAALSALQKAHLAEDDDPTRHIMSAAIKVLKGTADADSTIRDDDVSADYAKTLIEQLKSNDAEQVAVAAEELGELGEKRAVEALIIAFKNPKNSIQARLAIAESLLKLKSAPLEVVLLANLRNEDWNIRRNGAAILGQLKAEWAVEPLAKMLSDPHPNVLQTAAAALKYIGTPESRKALAHLSPSGTRKKPAKSKNVRKQIAGIEVKRPGKSGEATDKSSLLKRLQEGDEDTERAQHSTQPFSKDSEFMRAVQERDEANNKKDATQPTRDMPPDES